MDNVYCAGSEQEITSCRFDGWGTNDCDITETAGVICAELPSDQKHEEKLIKNHTKVIQR